MDFPAFDKSHNMNIYFMAALSSFVVAKNSHKLGLSQMVNAWYSFMDYAEWTQFGIITDIKDAYSFHLTQLLIEGAQKHGVFVTMNIQHCCTTEIDLYSPLPYIIFVSVSPQNAVQLLCTLYEKQLLWPKHVWVLHSNWYDASLRDLGKSYKVPPECNIYLARQGLIILRNQLRPDGIHSPLESGISYWNYSTILINHSRRNNITLQSNGYTNRLHDLVLAIALKLNNNYTLNSDIFIFRGAQGIV